MIRHRTIFPAQVNFNGWWVKSAKNGATYKLVHAGTNKNGDVLYHLLYETYNQIGNGFWPIKDIIEIATTIAPEKNLLNGKQTKLST